MKIKTNQVLVNLGGEPLKDSEGEMTLGKALANIVISAKEGGKMKLFILGQKLFTEKELEVDSADLNLLKQAVKNTEIYTALVAGQVEMLLEEVKE